MGKQELDNLVRTGTLKAEPTSRTELEGMPASARRALADAQNESISTASRFDLAYGPSLCSRGVPCWLRPKRPRKILAKFVGRATTPAPISVGRAHARKDS